MINALRQELINLANPTQAKILQRFFKTGVGEYGEGDVFLGVMVPQSRKIAKKFKDLENPQILKLLKSKIHEERLIALLILVEKFRLGGEVEKEEIFNLYLANTKYINNWDLVDLSAPKVVGMYLAEKDKNILLKLAKSDLIWDRRIAIISTYYFIKNQKEYEWTFKVAQILLFDKQDLIQKAVGWMLREVGKNISQEIEEQFLKKNYQKMPRTMLRYSIEHFSPELKLFYLSRSN